MFFRPPSQLQSTQGREPSWYDTGTRPGCTDVPLVSPEGIGSVKGFRSSVFSMWEKILGPLTGSSRIGRVTVIDSMSGGDLVSDWYYPNLPRSK